MHAVSFIVVTRAEVKAIRRALREQEGLPAKGVTVGPIAWEPPPLQLAEDGEPMDTPGWSIDNLDAGDEDGEQIAIEIPKRLERFAGKTVKGVKLPALVAEEALPEGIKRARAAKRAQEPTP